MPRGENNRRLSDTDRIEVVRRYTTPLKDGTWEGSTAIAASFGVNRNTILYTLQRANVTIRDPQESHAHGKRCGPIKHLEQLEDAPLCACGCAMPTYWIRSKYRWAKYAQGHRYTDAPYKLQNWLIEQYVVKGRTVDSLALECGVNKTTVIAQMERFGIKRRDARLAHKGVQAGEKNPAWKGGTTPERQQLYKTEEWKTLLKTVYARDNYTCQHCGRGTIGGKGLRSSVAHHIKSFAEYPDLRTEMTNLVTLCRECHLWVHSLENMTRKFLG
jgi:transposase-like protein